MAVCKMNPVLIIDNNVELEGIEKQHPELADAPLVLLSSSFSSQQLDKYKNRGYTYFDELITLDEGIDQNNNMKELVWNWFIDENGDDLSLINGCSLGSAFVSSGEVLMGLSLRFLTGLRKTLELGHTVYFSKKTDLFCYWIITFLQKEIGFSLVLVETEQQQRKTYGKHKLKIDAGNRGRDLAPIFKKGGLKEKIIAKSLKIFQKRSNEKKVVFVPGGKEQAYFEYSGKYRGTRKFNWLFPLSKDQLFNKNEGINFYYWREIGDQDFHKIGQIVKNMKSNIIKNCSIIEPELLIKLMDIYIFSYFVGAYNYYLNVRSTLVAEKPELVVLSADDYETYILIAQAAKKEKIATAITSHGLNSYWGDKKYRNGRFKVFDYALAYGKVDVGNYKFSGIKNNNIKITSFPYFERFLPVQESKGTNQYKKAVLLPLDIFNNLVLEKTAVEYRYLKDIYFLLNELKIELIGIKTRHSFSYNNLGLDDDIWRIEDHEIPLLSGYTTFPDAIKDADIVIGPASTALIEAGLLGKDYYVFQHTAFHEFIPSLFPSLFNYINASYSIEQLKKNILKKQPYKKGCSVNDLVDLDGVKSKEDLYRKYEVGIQEVLDDIEHSSL